MAIGEIDLILPTAVATAKGLRNAVHYKRHPVPRRGFAGSDGWHRLASRILPPRQSFDTMNFTTVVRDPTKAGIAATDVCHQPWEL